MHLLLFVQNILQPFSANLERKNGFHLCHSKVHLFYHHLGVYSYFNEMISTEMR